MSCFRVCPYCGSHLDPGEICDCRGKEGTPVSAANADEGGVEQIEKAVSASIINETEEKVK